MHNLCILYAGYVWIWSFVDVFLLLFVRFGCLFVALYEKMHLFLKNISFLFVVLKIMHIFVLLLNERCFTY